MMNVKMERCALPIIWLDTSVIIDITKYRENGELNDLQRKRMSTLNEIIYNKTREGKKLFVEGDQREEINSLIKETHKTQSFLSLGIKFQYRKAIHDKQLYRLMRAYVNNQDSVVLKYKDAFYRDPIEEIQEKNEGHLKGLIISVYCEVNNDELDQRKKRKEKLLELFEELRKKTLVGGITYEEQLEQEYTGLIQASRSAMRNMNNKILNGLDVTYEDFAQYSIFTDVASMWERLTNTPKGLMDFLTSEHYKAIPHIDIGSRLLARIITSVSPIESGDSMDVEHVSTVIPYCDFVITDRKMKNRIVQLGIDKKYDTKVYCLKDIDELLADLKVL